MASAGTLELRQVTKRYDGAAGSPAVADLTLVVPAGEVCVLIGPSGCGKTTALKMVNRLIEPSSGEILIDGRSVRDRPPAELRREIGYVIQQVGLLPHLTVAANVATVPRLLGWDKERITARVAELLDLIGLDPEEYGRRYPAQLSGGQQQRVGLARALAADPPVMLMDEPFSAVDPITRARLQADFLRLHRALPKTVVFVSHDIDEAVRMADKVAVMREGRLVQYAPPAEVLARPADPFVADFVGSDRALKGLHLIRLEEVPLPAPPLVRPGEPLSAVRERIARGDMTPVDGRVLVSDGAGRLGWLDLQRVATGEATAPDEPGPLLRPDATLRDALASLIEAGVSHGVVVDGDGRPVGIVGVEEIGAGVRRAGAGAPPPRG
ncbi:MAG: osmoprotectant transport system ATP-binding protein [Miltoncostaeaceae bacterium]|jgi:osmoprotectant transport system ATP-binding protein|nr:osmoprotectant transport system ATP-binding protein [Miltoncostaeaceae bacterium]